MTDFFTHITGQVIQPSIEIYPAITTQYILGPEVSGAGLSAEPSVLDSILQPVPAALTDRISIDQKGQIGFDHPMSSTSIDVETIASTLPFTSIQPQQASPNKEMNSPAADQALTEKTERYRNTSEPDIHRQAPEPVQRAVPNIGPET